MEKEINIEEIPNYNKIGERFKYNRVILEVEEWEVGKGCSSCYFYDYECPICNGKIRFKLVEQCDTKYMKSGIFINGIDEEHTIKINENTDEQLYGSFLNKLFATYKSKNADYGSAFAEMFDELGIDYAYGKLREKINRIKVLRKQSNMVENEGLEDALLDTAGYAILTLVELKKRNNSII